MSDAQVLTYNDIAKEFAQAGENLSDDISMIRITLFRDIHFDSFELEVCIFGKNQDQSAAPVVQKSFSITDDILDEERQKNGHSVEIHHICSLFDEKLTDLLIQKGIHIDWNPGESTEAIIDLSIENPDIKLFPEDQ